MSNTIVTTITTEQGTTVEFHRERANGTTRHIPTFVEGTEAYETATWVLEQRDEGVTMKAIAAEMHVSVPTVRRMINSMLLTLEVAEGEWDEFVQAHA